MREKNIRVMRILSKRKESDESEYRFAYLLIPTIIIALFMVVSNQNARNVFGIILILFILILDDVKYYYCILFLLTTAQLVKINGQTSILMILMVIGVFRVLIEKMRGIYVDLRIVVSFFALFLFSLFDYLIGSKDQLVEVIKHISFTVFFLHNYLKAYSRNQIFEFYYSSLMHIAGGAVTSGVLSICFLGFPRRGIRWSLAPEVSINGFAIQIAIVLINLIYVRLYYGDRISVKSKKILLFYAIMSAVFGVLTQSRSFILGMGIATVGFFMFSKNIKMKLKLIIVFCMIAICIVLFVSVNESVVSLYNQLSSRFRERDISNHRYELWEMTISRMYENSQYIWFGAGDYEYLKVAYAGANDYKGAHNVFIETWVVFGYLGVVILGANFYTIIKKYFTMNNMFGKELYRYIPILSLLAMLFFSHYFVGTAMSIIFLLCFCTFAIKV